MYQTLYMCLIFMMFPCVSEETEAQGGEAPCERTLRREGLWGLILIPYNSPFQSVQFSGFFSVFSVVQISSLSSSRTFSLPRKGTSYPLSVITPNSPLHTAPGNHTSAFCLWICLCWTFHVNGILSYVALGLHGAHVPVNH